MTYTNLFLGTLSLMFFSVQTIRVIDKPGVVNGLNVKDVSNKPKTSYQIKNEAIITRASHHINTTSDEYLPLKNELGTIIFFTAMDRTGFFDFKIDFTKAKNSGGEDIFFCELKNGVWSDARPVTLLNTNSHESVTHVNNKGDLLITGNYPENIGPTNNNENGSNTTDIFIAEKNKQGYQIKHIPEPINSIYNEFDGITDDNMEFIIFSSDRPGNIGQYHKKGWSWNNNKWGNSDIYVSVKKDYEWQKPINLGNKVNTPWAERSPWLSQDGLTLYLSSNGHKKGEDLDIYFFKRKNKNDWTNWEGPFTINNINSNEDDWGYKINKDGTALYSSATPFNYEITQKARSGDAGFKETNFRAGYKLFGAQSASLKSDRNTDIYFIYPNNKPQFLLSDILFEVNRFEIKSEYSKIIENLSDHCKQNPEKKLTIIGYTDNSGSETINYKLSFNRALSIKKELINFGVKNQIDTKGLGSENPITPNKTENDKKRNRRIEVYFK
jgi:outer membrane protein OmpA-like peptidoglycan-associated protein